MKKIISVILAAIMLAGCFSVCSFAEDSKTTQVKISVYDGTVIMPKQTISVTDGEAEKFGYTVPEKDHNGVAIDGITALDVLVAAHELYYGDLFTAETCSNYLKVSYGYVSYAFGKSATATGYSINDKYPCDDVENPIYGGYTGYSVNEAEMNDGDYLSFFYYLDTKYYADDYAWFNEETASVKEGSSVTLTLSGYSYMWYGYLGNVEDYTSALAGVNVYLVGKDGKYENVGKTDENGSITVNFDKAGDYQICAYGNTIDAFESEVPVSAAWCDVKVQKKTFFEKIADFFRMIFDFIANLFK